VLINSGRRLRRRCPPNSLPPIRSTRTATTSGRRRPNNSVAISISMMPTSSGSTKREFAVLEHDIALAARVRGVLAVCEIEEPRTVG
jgi:hypothetical protein